LPALFASLHFFTDAVIPRILVSSVRCLIMSGIPKMALQLKAVALRLKMYYPRDAAQV